MKKPLAKPRGRRTLNSPARSHKREVVRFRLGNGLELVLCPRPQLAQSYAVLFAGMGSRHETAEDNGLTHVLEHMLFRGTASWDDVTKLNASAEGFGGFLEGATYRDHMLLATACHPTALPDAIQILGELVGSPRYRAMETERAILREELQETLDGEGRMVDLDNLSHRFIFGTHGLGLPIEGTLDNLERFGVADLERHRQRLASARNLVLAVAGPFDLEGMVRVAELALSDLPEGERPPAHTPELVCEAPQLRFVRDLGSQIDVRLSFVAVPMGDPLYAPLSVLSRVLAEGLASRMHAELVDRRGLAYSLNAGLTTYDDCGLFEFEIAVSPHRASEAVQAIVDFARSASRFRYDRDELERVRKRYRYTREFMEDSAADLANWHGRAALFGIERETQELEERMQRVTASELRDAARAVFRPERLSLMAVGELARGEWSRVRHVVDRWVKAK